MTASAIGNYSLAFAVVAGVAGALTAVASVRSGSSAFVRAARWAAHGFTALLTVSGAVLVAAIVGDDFHIAYVARFSERALPLGYKLAAFWAGQEGSLLLWAWFLAVVVSITAWTRRKDPADHQAAVLAILAVICTVFAAVILLAANPFELSPVVPHDGLGLKPELQDPAMIAHPPLLFLGYAGFAVPLALVLGALIVRRTDRSWLAAVRRWTVASWLFLTVGIALGAWWAYVELGWGGYWAWDPIENASLMPWLTATALIHSLIAWQRRGMLKAWSASLAALTFILCILGTYLTRSGVVASVHAYAESATGWFFLALLVVGVVFSAGLIFRRRDMLEPDRTVMRLASTGAAFLGANVLLGTMMAAILVGTVFPLLTRPFTAHGAILGVRAEYYNTIVLPMALVLAALMGVGPMLTGGPDGPALRRRLVVPAAAAVAGAGISAVLGGTHVWMLISAAVGAFVAVGVGQDVVVRTFRPSGRPVQSGGPSAWRSLRLNARRYGALVTHLGMAILVVGVAGSSLYGVKQDLALRLGQSVQVGRFRFRIESRNDVTEQNYTAVEACVAVIGEDGRQSVLRPQLRRYHKASDLNSEVAIRSTLCEDVHVALLGRKEHGKITTLQVIIKPLVSWVWLGGTVMVAGALMCLAVRRPSKSRPPQTLCQSVRCAEVQPPATVVMPRELEESRI